MNGMVNNAYLVQPKYLVGQTVKTTVFSTLIEAEVTRIRAVMDADGVQKIEYEAKFEYANGKTDYLSWMREQDLQYYEKFPVGKDFSK